MVLKYRVLWTYLSPLEFAGVYIFKESSDFGSFQIALCGSTLKVKGKVKVPKDGVFPFPEGAVSSTGAAIRYIWAI